MIKNPVVVVGDGWGALGAVGFLALAGEEVRWVVGTGARMVAPLPSLEHGPGVEYWRQLASALGIECGDPQFGSFLREFRNKAFREPAWTKAPTPDARREVRNEVLWGPEHAIASLFETRFSLPVGELEEEIRRRLLDAERFPNVQRLEGVPVVGFRLDGNQVQAVLLGSGEEIVSERVIYADRWSQLPALAGVPKNLPFTRKREPMGIVQASFVHEAAVGPDLMEGFYGALHREAGEETERHLWGHFSQDGRRSFWSLIISFDEGEDNHAIAKKLRRMKSALDKMFVGPEWLPEGRADFMSTVVGEQVRFEESVIFSEGEAPTETITVASLKGVSFVTDGYGPSSALAQTGLALGIALERAIAPLSLFADGESQGPGAEAENIDPADPAAL
jgi:hypothetical protein